MCTGFMFSAYTHSPLHAGTGQSIGIVDLPIEREKHTNYPCVYASGVKGALRSFLTNRSEMTEERITYFFGSENANEAMGGAIFTDLKILLFPVRSSEGCFKWVTCPHVVSRFQTDYHTATNNNSSIEFGSVITPLETANSFNPNNHILLDDFIFSKNSESASQVALGNLTIPQHDIYVIDDSTFNYLVSFATQIIARNKLTENKTSDNLWYEEVLPTDTILYSFIKPSIINADSIDELETAINEQIVQIGGGETIGYGICEIQAVEG